MVDVDTFHEEVMPKWLMSTRDAVTARRLTSNLVLLVHACSELLHEYYNVHFWPSCQDNRPNPSAMILIVDRAGSSAAARSLSSQSVRAFGRSFYEALYGASGIE